MQSLSIQCLLPPVTPGVGSRIPQLADTSNVQVLNRRVLAVQIKVRDALLIRVATLRKVGNILLQSDGDFGVRHAADDAGARLIGVVEGVRNVEAVERGWRGEEV